MQTVLPRSWVEEFERWQGRSAPVADKERTLRFETTEQERRGEQAEDKREREESADLETRLAPPAAVESFRDQLEVYDAKTVEALMDNRHSLDAVRERLDHLLSEASVLPDGRRVFKTKDGQRVFDEHGLELASETIAPSSIDDKKPTWEKYKKTLAEGVRLNEERIALTDYQTKLDEARDRLDKDAITTGKLKTLKAGLAKDMPDALREKAEQGKPVNPSKADIASSPLPDDMDALMRQTGLGAPRTLSF